MIIEECNDSFLTRFRRNQLEEKLKSIEKQIEKKQADDFAMQNGLVCKENDGDILIIVISKLMQIALIYQVYKHSHFWKYQDEATPED